MKQLFTTKVGHNGVAVDKSLLILTRSIFYKLILHKKLEMPGIVAQPDPRQLGHRIRHKTDRHLRLNTG